MDMSFEKISIDLKEKNINFPISMRKWNLWRIWRQFWYFNVKTDLPHFILPSFLSFPSSTLFKKNHWMDANSHSDSTDSIDVIKQKDWEMKNDFGNLRLNIIQNYTDWKCKKKSHTFCDIIISSRKTTREAINGTLKTNKIQIDFLFSLLLLLFMFNFICHFLCLLLSSFPLDYRKMRCLNGLNGMKDKVNRAYFYLLWETHEKTIYIGNSIQFADYWGFNEMASLYLVCASGSHNFLV
jgi:hypothetical protein